MTHSPPPSKDGSTRDRAKSTSNGVDTATSAASRPGRSTRQTTSRSERGRALKTFTPEELAETKREMLSVSYADIEREFLEACEKSQEPRPRRRMQ